MCKQGLILASSSLTAAPTNLQKAVLMYQEKKGNVASQSVATGEENMPKFHPHPIMCAEQNVGRKILQNMKFSITFTKTVKNWI